MSDTYRLYLAIGILIGVVLAVLILAAGDIDLDRTFGNDDEGPTIFMLEGEPVPTPTTQPPPPEPTPTATLIPHPTLTPPLTWDAIDAELADPSSTWRREHLFRIYANFYRDRDAEMRKYDDTFITIEGPYSRRTEDHTIHLQWTYFGYTFNVTCRISPRLDARQIAYLDSIRQQAPAMTVRGEFLHKPGQVPRFDYIERDSGGIEIYLHMVYNICHVLTVDGQPWPVRRAETAR